VVVSFTAMLQVASNWWLAGLTAAKKGPCMKTTQQTVSVFFTKATATHILGHT